MGARGKGRAQTCPPDRSLFLGTRGRQGEKVDGREGVKRKGEGRKRRREGEHAKGRAAACGRHVYLTIAPTDPSSHSRPPRRSHSSLSLRFGLLLSLHGPTNPRFLRQWLPQGPTRLFISTQPPCLHVQLPKTYTHQHDSKADVLVTFTYLDRNVAPPPPSDRPRAPSAARRGRRSGRAPEEEEEGHPPEACAKARPLPHYPQCLPLALSPNLLLSVWVRRPPSWAPSRA